VDAAQAYSTTRASLLDVARSLDRADAVLPVAALPGWTVKDACAHLAGLCADVLDGNLDGAGTPPWTAVQVAARADASLNDVAAEWARRGPDLDEWIRAADPARTVFIPLDAWHHEQDIRSTVGLACARDDARVAFLAPLARAAFDRRFREAGVPALRLVNVDDDTEFVLGDGDAAATLRVGDYELLRIFSGRRSRAQLDAAGWTGDPAPFVDHMHLFELPVIDLTD
jgi:uncharacterized protein (TIGR03083 family)